MSLELETLLDSPWLAIWVRHLHVLPLSTRKTS